VGGGCLSLVLELVSIVWLGRLGIWNSPGSIRKLDKFIVILRGVLFFFSVEN
jgi:hypothetical protein